MDPDPNMKPGAIRIELHYLNEAGEVAFVDYELEPSMVNLLARHRGYEPTDPKLPAEFLIESLERSAMKAERGG